MRVLGLDLGSRTCGIALSDALKMTAQGLETYKYKENHYKHALEHIGEVIKKHNVSEIVLGFPKNMNNSVGHRAEIVLKFKKNLEEAYGLPVILWDERLTTMQVQRTLIDADMSRKKRKNVVDKMAAQVILQAYLDSK
jgi:putative Holliday junction resolvase